MPRTRPPTISPTYPFATWRPRRARVRLRPSPAPSPPRDGLQACRPTIPHRRPQVLARRRLARLPLVVALVQEPCCLLQLSTLHGRTTCRLARNQAPRRTAKQPPVPEVGLILRPTSTHQYWHRRQRNKRGRYIMFTIPRCRHPSVLPPLHEPATFTSLPVSTTALMPRLDTRKRLRIPLAVARPNALLVLIKASEGNIWTWKSMPTETLT